MVRGQADYGAYAPKEVTASVSDMGEVAARLGSIVTYDKRGDVVDFDNFEDTLLRWTVSVLGAGSYVRQSVDAAKSGSQAVLLHNGAVLNAYSAIQRAYTILGSQQLGQTISFFNLSTWTDLKGRLYYYDGVTVHMPQWKINATEQKLYVQLSDLAWHEVCGTGSLYTGYSAFHTIKLVADIATGLYKRIMFNNLDYDISTLAYRTQANATAPNILNTFILENTVAAIKSVVLDDFVLTQAEP